MPAYMRTRVRPATRVSANRVPVVEVDTACALARALLPPRRQHPAADTPAFASGSHDSSTARYHNFLVFSKALFSSRGAVAERKMEAPPGAPGPAAAAMRELLSALPDGVQRAEALQLLDRLIHEERACGGRLAHLSMSVTPNLGVPMGVRSDWAGSPGDLGPAGHIDSWGRFGGEDPSSFNTQMTGFIQSGWGETRPEGTAGNFLPNGDTGVGSLGEWQDMTRDIELEDNVSGLGPLSESRFLSFVLPSDAGRAPQGAGGNSGTMPLRTSTPAHPGHGSTAGGGMGLDPELTLTAKDSTPPGGKGGKDTWQGAVAPGQSAVGTVGSASRTSSATGLGAPQPGAGAEGKAGFKTAAQVGADTSPALHTNTHTHTPTHAHAHTQSINQ